MILANGVLSTAQTVIFALDRGPFLQQKNATIRKISFFNTDPIAQTAILSIRKANTTLIFSTRQFVLQQDEGGEYLEPGELLELANGDEVLAETTTASAVNFLIVGDRV